VDREAPTTNASLWNVLAVKITHILKQVD
jgi:hypothetical protein